MPVYIGGIDPLKVIEGILNKLIEKGVLTADEAGSILEDAKAK